MATESTVNEKQGKRKEKDEKQSSTNHGCGCCEFCKVITSEIEPELFQKQLCKKSKVIKYEEKQMHKSYCFLIVIISLITILLRFELKALRVLS